MKDEKGEITLLSCLLLFALTSLVLLSALELRKSFLLLQKRTNLFLCVKQTKGEFHSFMKFMGRSNWAIKNINRVSLVMAFIPGLQGAAANAQKAKKYIQYAQNTRVVSYLKTLKDLPHDKCTIDPRMYITPYKLGTQFLKRDGEGAAILRDNKWTYYYFAKPYLLSLEINAEDAESLDPKISYKTEEKAAKLSSLLSSLSL
jgi:hypothetical protein